MNECAVIITVVLGVTLAGRLQRGVGIYCAPLLNRQSWGSTDILLFQLRQENSVRQTAEISQSAIAGSRDCTEPSVNAREQSDAYSL